MADGAWVKANNLHLQGQRLYYNVDGVDSDVINQLRFALVKLAPKNLLRCFVYVISSRL